MAVAADLALALAGYPGLEHAEVDRIPGGLINETHLVTAPHGRFVLQRVSPIFDPSIHETIEAVTRALEAGGVPTPRLVPTRDGRLFATVGGRVFRVMTHVEGATFDRVRGEAQARSAGLLVGRFHRALDRLEHGFPARRLGVHDTPTHLGTLASALEEHPGHRLLGRLAPLARAVLARAAALPPLVRLAERPCHGDLKLSNVRFAGSAPPAADEAVCLLDLDTLAPMQLAHELGDAWRSWCNRAGEDRTEAELDLAVFAASLDGYLEGADRTLADDERTALLLGPEWVSLELAARFGADALAERYFGWDASRYPGRGEHNLQRALGQWSLHEAFVATRSERARALGVS